MTERGVCEEVCKGFVRKGIFDKTCKNCGRASSEHPPVELSIEGRDICDDWENVEPAFQRLVSHVWERLQKKCIPALKRVKTAWKFKESHVDSEHARLCSLFLEDAAGAAAGHRGCCNLMIKKYKQMESIIQENLNQEATRVTVDDLKTSRPIVFGQYIFFLKSWSACKAEMLQYDQKIKNGCGRKDFVDPDFRPAAAARPPFEDKKEATKCPVCESTFDKLLGVHQKKHCRRCLRVVCGKCATKRQASPEGPKVRLCYECLPFS